MSKVVFKAGRRAEKGSAPARRLRRSGRIPAVMYGRKGDPVSIDLDAREFAGGVKGISESTIVSVDIDGVLHDAFVKDTQRDIRDGAVLHVDFYEIETNALLRARVAVRILGSPVGVREGGVLETPLHDIEVECFPKDLPERIDVDIAPLKVNQAIHVRDIQLGSGVKLISNPDQVVALVKFAKAAGTETAQEAAAPAAGAAPAPEGEKKA